VQIEAARRIPDTTVAIPSEWRRDWLPYASCIGSNWIRHRSCKYEVTRFDGYYQAII